MTPNDTTARLQAIREWWKDTNIGDDAFSQEDYDYGQWLLAEVERLQRLAETQAVNLQSYYADTQRLRIRVAELEEKE